MKKRSRFMRQVSLRSHYLLLAAISLGILGCAGATITPEQAPPPPQATTARTTRPDQVIVYD
ncbi:MAG TPA: hypothetical protein VMT64_03805, partial [Candidatus Binataceae bacterium]|nr:hypothetical protein [Candidatus Binataceae bacterium]